MDVGDMMPLVSAGVTVDESFSVPLVIVVSESSLGLRRIDLVFCSPEGQSEFVFEVDSVEFSFIKVSFPSSSLSKVIRGSGDNLEGETPSFGMSPSVLLSSSEIGEWLTLKSSAIELWHISVWVAVSIDLERNLGKILAFFSSGLVERESATSELTPDSGISRKVLRLDVRSIQCGRVALRSSWVWLEYIRALVSPDSVRASGDLSGGLVLELKRSESFEAVRFLRPFLLAERELRERRLWLRLLLTLRASKCSVPFRIRSSRRFWSSSQLCALWSTASV